ncbi:hypothetical protein AB0L33_33665 [Streptomyces sp. NPDC052299]|uniref:hypothetical protein n=1 Tax=Streptomyces sp. NPDC052299 TaxID=3155054 RepID=UPI00342AC338
MIDWALVALLSIVLVLVALIVGGVAAALPDPAAPHWADRCRRGGKAFTGTLTALIAFVGMIVLVWGALR